jgi:pyridoxal/pyridoxine/pyridoxamine kinase
MEINIRIPESWQDVTLQQYLKFYNAMKPYDGAEEYTTKIIELAAYYLCNIDANTLNRLPLDTFNEVAKSLLDLINSGKKQELVKSFEIGNTKYGFVTNLDQMTYGEYVDLVTYSKDVYENAALMCSILYRPILEEHKGQYRIQDYKGTNENQIELFYQKLTMDIIFGALGFFLRLQKDLLNSTLTYTTEAMTKMMQETPTSTAAQILAENGVSTEQLQLLQEMIQQSSTQLQD